MRITFLSASLDLSGGSRVISTYAKMFAQHGHQVTVVGPAHRPAPLRQRIRSFLRSGKWDPHYGGISHYDNLGLDIRRVSRPPITVDDVPDADAIVATWWETAEWVNAFPARKGTKIYFVQGHEVFDFLPVERSRATYHMPFHKIVVSSWLQRIMADTYGDRSAVLVPNAIDHAAFTTPPRAKQAVPTVGFMYARGALKGADAAMAAIARMREKLPNLRVVSFGTHTPLDLDGFEHVDFQLLPTPEQLRNAYASCDVWLCTSRSEGFGLPTMEAMGCRTPVVSTAVGWPVDAVRNGENGYLVDIDDVQGLAEGALKCLTLSPADWLQMSERAHATATAYTWDRSYAEFEAAVRAAQSADNRQPA